MNIKSIYFASVCILPIIFSPSFAQDSYQAPLVKNSLLLDIAADDAILVVGERGHVLRASADASSIDDFVQVSIPTKATLTSVHTIGTSAWAAGHDASIVKSIDSGKTWRLIQAKPDLDRPFLDLLFFDNNEGIAVGAYGLFYRSLDGGETWQQETHPSVLSAEDNEYLESIKDDEAFYLEELGYISPHFNKLYFQDDILYLAGEAGLLAKSTDKGRSWLRLDINYEGSFFDVSLLDSNKVLAVGLRGNMFVSNDDQWQRVPTCITTTLNSIVNTPSNVYVMGNNGVMLKLNIDEIDTSVLQAPDNEGCQRSGAIELLDSKSSDAILTAGKLGDVLVVVTAGGLKTVIEE